jgi:membrane protease YdiL (CAAX protease family)
MSSTRPPRLDRPYLVWLVLLYGGWTLAWGVHQALLHRYGLLADRNADTGYWLVCKVLIWLVPVAILIRRERGAGSISDWLGLKTVRGVSLGVVVSVLWLGVLAAEARLLRHSLPAPASIDAGVLSALIVAPVCEELLFRGFALKRLRELGSPPSLAVAVSALAFALLHVPGWLFQGAPLAALPIKLAPLVIFGVVLGTLRFCAPSLWAPILVHFSNNAWHQGALAWLLASI